MSLFSKIFNKKNKGNILKNAIVFVDYEHWFIGYENTYRKTPDISEWFDELSENYNVKAVYFFANFQKFKKKEEEIKKIRIITNKIIDTFNPDLVSEKDYTDFIILDNIYQSVLSGDKYDTYIIFTGDGHFQSVTAYLKNICKKEVGIFGVKNSINKNLYASASWVKEVSPVNNKQITIYNALFSILYKLNKKKDGKIITYPKTVKFVSEKNGFNEADVAEALKKLIDDGYINRKVKSVKTGKDGSKTTAVKTLEVNWKKVYKDKIWSNK